MRAEGGVVIERTCKLAAVPLLRPPTHMPSRVEGGACLHLHWLIFCVQEVPIKNCSPRQTCQSYGHSEDQKQALP